MKYAYIYFIFFFIIVLSCKEKKDSYENVHSNIEYKFNLVSANERIVLPVNERIINRSTCIIPYASADSINRLYYLNNNKIVVFCLNENKLLYEIILDYEGPDGVGGVNGFEVYNPDSICVTSSFIQKIFLINGNGEVLSKIDYSNFEKDYHIHSGITRTLSNMRIGYKDSLIYLPFYTGYDAGNYKYIDPDKMRMISVIDTINREVKTLNIGFPKTFWKERYYPSFFGFFIENGNFYINYMYDNKIMKSEDGINWKAHSIPSRYADVRKIVKNDIGRSACFKRLVYDKYRNVFYRFVEHQCEGIKNRASIDILRYAPDFSIIILDENLNIIGETKFPSDTYDPNGYFIAEDGLYLSVSNPFNPDYSVDKLEFELFEVL